jgi:hypothetical protein
LKVIDEDLRRHIQERWLKVARIVAYGVRQGGFSLHDENIVRLHVRRVKVLVESGLIEAAGDLLRPRWCDVRTARKSEPAR